VKLVGRTLEKEIHVWLKRLKGKERRDVGPWMVWKREQMSVYTVKGEVFHTV
jgi:hypothetical protein